MKKKKEKGKPQKKKSLAFRLASLMFVRVSPACAKTAPPSQEEPPAPPETADPAAPADETPADAPADDNPFAEEVTLHWAFPALQDSFPGFEAINEKLNEITKEKINAKIEFEMIPLGEYTEKMLALITIRPRRRRGTGRVLWSLVILSKKVITKVISRGQR